MSDHLDLLARVSVAPGEGAEVFEPATGDLLGHAPRHETEDLERALAAARAAQPAWAARGHAERSAALVRIADRVDASAEALAQLLAREQGKPLNGPNARFEVGAVSSWLRATAALELDPEVVLDDGTTRAELVHQPLGVVGAISPWNWPLMISTWQFAPALRMGNTVVLKPSENTSLSVLALVALAAEELPEGVFSAVTGRGLGAQLASHPGVDKIMFTGSTETGRRVVEASAGNLARLTLELGGNDAGIVLPDVDPAAVAEGIFWGAFINTGQTCAALKRLYVHESRYDEVLDALAEVVARTPMGPSLDETSLLGPLQNRQQFDVVSRLVQDAKAAGGRVVVGGEPASDLGELFFQATLVADVADGTALVDEEQFGPVLPVVKYRDVDEAVASANGLDVGLGASVWSSDHAAARAVAERLQAGTVWINSHGGVHPLVPFGGVKGSGYGVEFGVEGLKALGSPKVISGPTPASAVAQV